MAKVTWQAAAFTAAAVVMLSAAPALAAAPAGQQDPTSAAAPDSGTVASQTASAPRVIPSTVVIGRSWEGRQIVAVRQGNAQATKVLLVLGQMHGNETRAPLVVDAVRRLKAQTPSNVAIWTIRTMNPDGAAHGTRRNAHNVDLNRNFPYLWSASVNYPAPRSVSEVETRAVYNFLRFVRPDVVVSFHQPFGLIDGDSPKSLPWAYFLANYTGVPVGIAGCSGPCYGTMTSWFNARFPGWAMTFEFGSYPSQALIDRTARTLVTVLPPRVIDYR